uniref:Crystaline entomocidal protoxin n=1 Tax=Bacillus thuringiensis TaxID=1428 RepID=Q3B9W6_BACTU|nr:Cry [Bacillus thuringiensis]
MNSNDSQNHDKLEICSNASLLSTPPYKTEYYEGEVLMDTIPFSSGKSAAQMGTSIVGQILGVLGVPFALQVTNLYSSLLDTLWPDGKSQWEIFMEQVEEIVDQKIENYARNKALAELEGLGNNFEVYLEALENWQSNTRDINDVKIRFISLDSLFTQSMPSFRIEGFQLPLLSVYAQAANLHLLLLRDATTFGKEWGLDSATMDSYYKRQKALSAEYSDHCVKWYKNGLNKLSKSTAKDWVKFNQFRREMTLTVLDVVALFPNYDAKIYPMQTVTQLTREVYTDPVGMTNLPNGIGSWYDIAPTFATIENAVIRKPHLFDFIRNLYVYFGDRGASANRSMKFWNGHEIFYANIGSSVFFQVYNYVKLGSNNYPYVFVDRDIYQTESLAGCIYDIIYPGYTYKFFGAPKVEFHVVDRRNNTGIFTFNPGFGQIIQNVQNSLSQLPLESLDEPAYEAYSHRLCHVTLVPPGNNSNYEGLPVYSWTHKSASLENVIYPDKITQIPAVKSFPGGQWGGVEAGPGFTGGDVTKSVTSEATTILRDVVKLAVTIPQDSIKQKYRVRIRYASQTDIPATFFTSDSGNRDFVLKSTTTAASNAFENYKEFQYIDIPGTIEFTKVNEIVTVYLHAYKVSNHHVNIDKVEFIPVDNNFEARKQLETSEFFAKKLLDTTKESLDREVTDYQIDYTAKLVECVSDELYPMEKQELLNIVTTAKKLSQDRNLLQDIDFSAINRENGWIGSRGIEGTEGNINFKSRSVRLPGARNIDGKIDSTYFYQKINASKLKPYTRYELRGRIESSKKLEIYLIHHNANRIIKNVNGNNSLLNSYNEIDPCISKCSNHILSIEEAELDMNNHTNFHEFSLCIDTGELDLNKNIGIWVAFKISDLNGYAELRNIECIEVEPLFGEALEKLKKQEQEWTRTENKQYEESKKIRAVAIKAVEQLFEDSSYQKLRPELDLSNISKAENLVNSIPYVSNDWFSYVPGINHNTVEELKTKIQLAFALYRHRNSIQNGDFKNGLNSWTVTSDVVVEENQIDPELVISNWSSQVSQDVVVEANHRYLLRVTAKKENVGIGYITIHDSTDNSKSIVFDDCEKNQDHYVTKTTEFIPSTDKVYIKIHETDGIFRIKNIDFTLNKK